MADKPESEIELESRKAIKLGERDPKDAWDKLEIISKLAVPVLIGVAAIWFNNQISTRQQTATMTQIAVGVVSETPDYKAGESRTDPLRDWAISVLQNPGTATPLTEEAATALRNKGLPVLSVFGTSHGGSDAFGSGAITTRDN